MVGARKERFGVQSYGQPFEPFLTDILTYYNIGKIKKVYWKYIFLRHAPASYKPITER